MVSVVALAGCGVGPLHLPDEQRRADTVALVAAQVLEPGVGLVVTLEGGQTATFPDWGAVALNGSVPRVGDLLMSGTTNGKTWAVSIYPATAEDAPPGCFRLLTRGRNDGSGIVTELGLRLDRAPEFKQGWGKKGEYDAVNIAFCLDAKGVATSFGY
jgi:predicted small lipoprotein YifL